MKATIAVKSLFFRRCPIKAIVVSMVVLFSSCCDSRSASVNWVANNIYAPDVMGVTTSNLMQYGLVYLFLTSQTHNGADTSFGVSSVDFDNIVSLVASKSDVSSYAAKIGNTGPKGAVAGATGYNGKSFDNGDALSGFLVIFDSSNFSDAKYFMVTGIASAAFNGSSGAQQLNFGTQKNNTWRPFVSVPEPASSALAMISLVAFGTIRRRRAIPA